MGRLWRLFVVVIVLTLAPMQAWAECAWVLWASSNENKEGWSAFEPRRGFKSESTCDAELTRLLGPVKQAGEVTFKLDGGKTLGMKYRCLPDTIDPRAPKGK